MHRTPRSVRLTFDNARSSELRLVGATPCLALPLPSHDRGPRTGVTGFWVQLEDAHGHVLYRRDEPGLLLDELCANGSPAATLNDAGEHARFDVLVPHRTDAATVSLFGPPRLADGRRPHLGRASERLGSFPYPTTLVPHPVRSITLPADICGDGRGQVLSVLQVVNHGRIGQIYNLVVLAEAFLESEQDDFVSKARACADYFLSRPPFDGMLGSLAMNVFFVRVSSLADSINDPTRTYFATIQPDPDRTSIQWDYDCVQTVCDALFSENGMPYWNWAGLVVHETSKKVGTRRGSQFAQGLTSGYELIFQHELGHAAFGLGDEYDGTEGTYSGTEPNQANLTTVTSAASLKWAAFLTPGVPIPTLGNPTNCGKKDGRSNPVSNSDVGLYAGGKSYSCGLFHPQYKCVMHSEQDADGVFCTICLQQGKKVLASAFPLHVPAPGSLYYSPISESWSHAPVTAEVTSELGLVQDDPSFQTVVNELLAGSVGQAVRALWSGLGHPLPASLEVHQGFYDAGEANGVWYLIDTLTRDTYFVHAYTVTIETMLRVGTIALPDYPSVSSFDTAVVGTQVHLFSVDGGLLAHGTVDSSGHIAGGGLAVQDVPGLADELSSVSVALLGKRLWVAAVDALEVKLAAYELLQADWAAGGFGSMPSETPVDFSRVRCAVSANQVHVLALGATGLWYGLLDTVSGAWQAKAAPTPVQGDLTQFALAADGSGLYVVARGSAGTDLYHCSPGDGSWSTGTPIDGDLGLDPSNVVTELDLAILNGVLHLVASVDLRPEHARYDLTAQRWLQPLKEIAPLASLAPETTAVALHATNSQVYLALSEATGTPTPMMEIESR